MNVDFSRTFEKDLQTIHDPKLLRRIRRVIGEVREARALAMVRNIKRLETKRAYYRVRIGNFRLGFELIGGRVLLLRCLDRKEIYRHFP